MENTERMNADAFTQFANMRKEAIEIAGFAYDDYREFHPQTVMSFEAFLEVYEKEYEKGGTECLPWQETEARIKELLANKEKEVTK